MTLSPEIATLLREALDAADQVATAHPQLAYQVVDQARAYRLRGMVMAAKHVRLPRSRS